MRTAVIVVSFIALSLAGCARIETVDSYDKVAMQRAERMPSEQQLNPDTDKGVIFPAQLTEDAKIGLLETVIALVDNIADPNADSLVEDANPGHVVAETLKEDLKVTGMQFVEPSAASRLKKQLTRKETEARATTEQSAVADYVFASTVETIDSRTSSVELSVSGDDDEEQEMDCSYEINASGQIQIYDIPALTPAKTIDVEGSWTRVKDTTENECPSLNRTQWEILAETAVREATEDGAAAVKNYVGPRAYILERRAKGDKNIFKLSLGEKRGFEWRSDVHIYRPAAGEKVAEATVTNRVGDDYAWVLIDEPETAEKVRRGYYAKVHYD